MAGKLLLMTEGPDDQHVWANICVRHQLALSEDEKSPGRIHIVPCEGIDRLLETFPQRLKTSDIEAVGVVADADTDVLCRWRSLRNHLVNGKYGNVPDMPDPNGTIVPAPPDSILPRVGIWLMPDNRTAGILEDFLRFLVPKSTPLFDRAERAVAAIPDDERLFNPKDMPKALIHTWLAWQAKPGKPLGLAIQARYLDPEVQEAQVFVSWLQRLFFPAEVAHG